MPLQSAEGHNLPGVGARLAHLPVMEHAAHQHVFQHRHLVERLGNLEGAADAPAADVVRGEAGDVLIAEIDAPAG